MLLHPTRKKTRAGELDVEPVEKVGTEISPEKATSAFGF